MYSTCYRFRTIIKACYIYIYATSVNKTQDSCCANVTFPISKTVTIKCTTTVIYLYCNPLLKKLNVTKDHINLK